MHHQVCTNLSQSGHIYMTDITLIWFFFSILTKLTNKKTNKHKQKRKTKNKQTNKWKMQEHKCFKWPYRHFLIDVLLCQTQLEQKWLAAIENLNILVISLYSYRFLFLSFVNFNTKANVTKLFRRRLTTCKLLYRTIFVFKHFMLHSPKINQNTAIIQNGI